MMNTRTARMLTRYNAWANRMIFDAVAALPAGEAIKERQSLFRNMVHTLNHNYVIGLIWQAHLCGRGHGFSGNIPGIRIKHVQFTLFNNITRHFY